MNLKIIAVASSIAVLAFASAHAEDTKSAFTGPYVGVQGGYSTFDNKITASSGVTIEGDTKRKSSIEGGAFLGYGQVIDNLYLGVETEGLRGNKDKSVKWTYGASARAGFLPTKDVLLYSRLGAVRSNVDKFAEEKKNTWVDGIRFGLGAEAAVAPAITVRAEWSHTNYKDIHTDVGSGFLAKEKIDSSRFIAGAAYHF